MSVTYYPPEGKASIQANGVKITSEGMSFDQPRDDFETLVSAGILSHTPSSGAVAPAPTPVPVQEPEPTPPAEPVVEQEAAPAGEGEDATGDTAGADQTADTKEEVVEEKSETGEAKEEVVEEKKEEEEAPKRGRPRS
jgi:hypothetical protein